VQYLIRTLALRRQPDEVSVQDMKKALNDPKLGIKVIDVREAGDS
jgi:hypothetical protein